MRLRHRMNVDLPQPEGPMIAVTALGAIASPMSRRTWRVPNQALRSLTRIPSAMPSPHRAVAAARRDSRRETDQEDQGDQHQRAGPRLAVPVVEGRDRVREDLERERGDRLIEALVPEAVAEGPEEQRRRLARPPGHGHHDAPDAPR